MDSFSEKIMIKSIFIVSKKLNIPVKVINEILIDGGFNREFNKYKLNSNEINYLKNYFVNQIINGFDVKRIKKLNNKNKNNFVKLYSLLVENSNDLSEFISIDELINERLDELKIEKFVNDFFIIENSIFLSLFKSNKHLIKLNITFCKIQNALNNFSIIIPINKYHIFNDEENQERNNFLSISLLISKMRDVIVNSINNNYIPQSLCNKNILT